MNLESLGLWCEEHRFETTSFGPEHSVADFPLGTYTLRYEWIRRRTSDEEVRFSLFPNDLKDQLVDRRGLISTHPSIQRREDLTSAGDAYGDSCVQVALRGEQIIGGYASGVSMRNSRVVTSLKFRSQRLLRMGDALLVETQLEHESGLLCRHRVFASAAHRGVLIEQKVENEGGEALTLEHLSSFVLGNLTPFATDDAPERLRLRRMRTAWSGEGRETVEAFEALHLERSWTGHAPVVERFGQVGSMPVRKFFPLAAVEDTKAGVTWAARLLWHGSWQMEVGRRDDPVVLAGGPGDYEFAHWAKTLAPGETITTPLAWVTVTASETSWLEAQNRVHDLVAEVEPPIEESLPIIFNEWCSSWGNPTHDAVVEAGRVAAKLGVDIFVIDDGWAEKPDRGFQFNGDWNVDEERFPGGLKPTVDALRTLGLKAGLWYEIEACNEGTEAFQKSAWHLHRNGTPVYVGNRHFWDFRLPEVKAYLRDKVIRQLAESGFEYLKVDYNDCIGLGCDTEDPAGALGEGLREHLNEVEAFFGEIRRDVPNLMIENCSSGGHRLEPGIVGRTTMSSFSDAHETVEIPLIAANTHELIPPRKNQVWAVLRKEDSARRMEYSLAATFCGRMCLSGEIREMSPEKLEIVSRAIGFYRKVAPIIRSGRSRVFRHYGPSFRYPRGWQAVRRISDDGTLLMGVFHFFERSPAEPVEISLPEGGWKIVASFGSHVAELHGASLLIQDPKAFSAYAVLLERIEEAAAG